MKKIERIVILSVRVSLDVNIIRYIYHSIWYRIRIHKITLVLPAGGGRPILIENTSANLFKTR